MTAIEWAKEATKLLGWREAYNITVTVGRPLIGLKNDIKNPHYPWYRDAKIWIKNNSPVELIN